MKAIEILLEEHEVIQEFLGHLEVATQRILNDKGPPKEFFESSLSFCRNFADKYHHYKEEYVMFGLLAQKKDGALDGEIERHRNQHENCRNLVQAISESLDGYSRKLDSTTRTVHRNLADYIETLRKHITSENEIFFPMVQKALTESEQENLLQEFIKYEEKVGPEGMESQKKLVAEIGRML